MYVLVLCTNFLRVTHFHKKKKKVQTVTGPVPFQKVTKMYTLCTIIYF